MSGMIELKPHDRVILLTTKTRENYGATGVVIKIHTEKGNNITVFWDKALLTTEGLYSYITDTSEKTLQKLPFSVMTEVRCDICGAMTCVVKGL